MATGRPARRAGIQGVEATQTIAVRGTRGVQRPGPSRSLTNVGYAEKRLNLMNQDLEQLLREVMIREAIQTE
ncbi:MAG: hypothetical protein C4294_08155 [Nitrospiraceae bacterium]